MKYLLILILGVIGFVIFMTTENKFILRNPQKKKQREQTNLKEQLTGKKRVKAKTDGKKENEGAIFRPISDRYWRREG